VQPLQRAATTALKTTQKTLQMSGTLREENLRSVTDRRVRLDGGLRCHHDKYANNSIKSSKYNIVTFFPVFLFEMFSRVAYLYFLFQAALSWWSVVSPTGGAGSTMALLFVLVVAGVKAIAEDMKRHREDHITNNTVAHVMRPDGSVQDVRWREVEVGNIVKICDDELIPADLVCLHSELTDNVCFVKTTNLDGESNLKIRRPLQLRELIQVVKDLGPGGLVHIKGTLQCERPNADLHNFKGRFNWQDDGAPGVLPVTMNEILLRGTLVKNSGAVYGLVVYTGEETRIQMNNRKVPFKNGAYNSFLNLQIALVGGFQILLCIFFAVLSYFWKDIYGQLRYYMAFDVFVEGNYRSPAVYIGINFLTFWILESYMVPISLFVTVEIVKFWQGFVFINRDPLMVDAESGETARCRNSNLMEDLGKIEYVFSDKTGTLTSNDMRLRQIAVKGLVYGSKDVALEEDAPHDNYHEAMDIFDPNMAEVLDSFKQLTPWNKWTNKGGSRKGLRKGSSHRLALEAQEEALRNGQARATAGNVNVNGDVGAAGDAAEPAVVGVGFSGETSAGEGQEDAEEPQLLANTIGLNGLHLIDFWTNICVCHSLIVETDDETGATSVQGPSPDEVALVNTARQLGFHFLGRDASNIYLDLQGEKVQFEVLNVLEFSSDRRRMSVIARSPDGTIRLFIKGADSTILQLVSKEHQDSKMMAEVERNLRLFAQQGLRTLCIATKVLSRNEWMTWDKEYQTAAADLDDRDAASAAAAELIEKDLDFVGVTAIEDKLQEGVPESIATLLDAGIRVWMITGDKRETAINIAVSCRLLKSEADAMLCEAGNPREASAVLERLLADAQARPGDEDAAKRNSRVLTRAPTGSSMKGAASCRPATAKELVIDGRTLAHILDTPLEEQLALLSSMCASVVVCRASPSQKASIVLMMKRFEAQQAAGKSRGLWRWLKVLERGIHGKMLSIGDGANDVAMIQAADVGVGVMGKEGRQAVNNSDYAFAEFRYLVRLLLVHGQLSDYRIAYLVKYSFYKNICFAAVLSYYQFFNGFSGTIVIDDISAFMYNVVFTALPIGIFAISDRMMSDTMMLLHPRTYNTGNYLNSVNFWKTGIMQGVLDGAIIFFVPFLCIDHLDANQITDVGSLGKVVYIGMLGSVTLEVALAARFWTYPFALLVFVSYFLVYPFIFGYSELLQAAGIHDPVQIGVGSHIMSSSSFWFIILIVNLCTSGHRILLYCIIWAYYPKDTQILSEKEYRFGAFHEAGWQSVNRLEKIGAEIPEEVANRQSAARFSRVYSRPVSPSKAPSMAPNSWPSEAPGPRLTLGATAAARAASMQLPDTPGGQPATPAVQPTNSFGVSKPQTPSPLGHSGGPSRFSEASTPEVQSMLAPGGKRPEEEDEEE